MRYLTHRESSFVMALLLLVCVALSVGWYLDRTALAEDLAKVKYDFLWLMRQSGDAANVSGEQ